MDAIVGDRVPLSVARGAASTHCSKPLD